MQLGLLTIRLRNYEQEIYTVFYYNKMLLHLIYYYDEWK